MAILLTILKVIGIILLVILGLVLLIILLVLFSPISYRITANHNENDTRARAKVSFLVVNGLVSFIKGEGLDYGVKVLFFKIYPRGGKKKPGSPGEEQVEDYFSVDLPDEEELQSLEGAGSENVSEETHVAEDETGQDETVSSDDTTNDEDMLDIDAFLDSDEDSNDDAVQSDNIDESSDNVEQPEGEDNISEKKESKLSAILSKFKKKDRREPKAEKEKVPLTDKIDEALDKADEKIDELDKKYIEAMKKLDHVDQFLDKVYVQKTIKRAFKIIKRLFGTIKPKKSKGYIHMGLGSAADTGMILGKLAAFYPLYGRWLTIEPDFYYKVIEGDIDIKGRIYLFRFVGPALGMVLTPSFWKTIKLAKKI